MKRLIGVLVVTSVIGIGTYYYRSPSSDMRVEGSKSAAPANVSTPLTEEAKIPTTNKEEIKKLPDLDSLKGLEQESSDLFSGTEGLPSQTNSDPLKDASQ